MSKGDSVTNTNVLLQTRTKGDKEPGDGYIFSFYKQLRGDNETDDSTLKNANEGGNDIIMSIVFCTRGHGSDPILWL